jgi:hypothetical protein
MVSDTSIGSARVNWRSLQIAAVVAAFLAALVFRRWLSAEASMLRSFGMVHFDINVEAMTAADWFSVLQSRRFLGLLMLNAFDLINYGLVSVTYLGLHSVLRRYDRVWATTAMAVCAIGVAIHLSSTQAFNLLSLSNQYAAATSETQRNALLAAGQFSLALNDPVVFGTGLFWSYICLYLAGLILSLLMLRNHVFGRWPSTIGIVASATGLGYFATAAFAPSWSIIPAVGSAPFNLAWYILIGVSLFRYVRKATP